LAQYIENYLPPGRCGGNEFGGIDAWWRSENGIFPRKCSIPSSPIRKP